VATVVAADDVERRRCAADAALGGGPELIRRVRLVRIEHDVVAADVGSPFAGGETRVELGRIDQIAAVDEETCGPERDVARRRQHVEDNETTIGLVDGDAAGRDRLQRSASDDVDMERVPQVGALADGRERPVDLQLERGRLDLGERRGDQVVDRAGRRQVDPGRARVDAVDRNVADRIDENVVRASRREPVAGTENLDVDRRSRGSDPRRLTRLEHQRGAHDVDRWRQRRHFDDDIRFRRQQLPALQRDDLIGRVDGDDRVVGARHICIRVDGAGAADHDSLTDRVAAPGAAIDAGDGAAVGHVGEGHGP
jgi:hypothetical protein